MQLAQHKPSVQLQDDAPKSLFRTSRGGTSTQHTCLTEIKGTSEGLKGLDSHETAGRHTFDGLLSAQQFVSSVSPVLISQHAPLLASVSL